MTRHAPTTDGGETLAPPSARLPQDTRRAEPNAQAEARATQYKPAPATKRTLWPVASSAVLASLQRFALVQSR